MKPTHYEDPEVVRRYAQGLSNFVPAYEQMQRMAGQLLQEHIGETGEILVLGAGGGLELEAFARRCPGWSFTGVDPATEMLKAARERVASAGASNRVRWHQGYIFDAPPGPFDAATCMLTLHFVPDDGEKQRTLTHLRQRLKPGAPLILVDCCIELAAPTSARALARYRTFALESGADPEQVDTTCGRLATALKTVSASRDEALLAAAGYTDLELFYAALSWRGWRASA